jgi:hypothetical protein
LEGVGREQEEGRNTWRESSREGKIREDDAKGTAQERRGRRDVLSFKGECLNEQRQRLMRRRRKGRRRILKWRGTEEEVRGGIDCRER